VSATSSVRRGSPDGGILTATAILTAVGLVAVYSATAPLTRDEAVPRHFVRHASGVVVGIVVVAIAMRIPLSVWRRAALPLWGASVGLLACTLAWGVRVHGAQRWIALPGTGLTFQPGEIAKWATLLAIAAVLSRRDPRAQPAMGQFAPVLLFAALPAGLLLLQPDTGNAVLLLGLTGLLCFVAGSPLGVLVVAVLMGVLGLGAALVMRPYALERLRGFWDPWSSADAAGFQLVQSFVAFGRGGAFGVGLGDGRQKLFYLPEAHTDFVLSVVAEELGLVGVALVIGAFAALLMAGCRIAARARERFALLVVFAMTALLTVPAALNAAVVMGMVPPKGLALPFVSYGRTSLLVCFLAVGVLLGAGCREAAPRPRAATSATPRRSWRR
jgi:cell division protein FtsW